MGRHSSVPPKYDPNVVELDGDLRCAEVVELLQGIRFVWADETHTLTIDRDVRDLFVNALQAKR